MTEEINWKSLAVELANQLLFVIGNIRAQGSGSVYNSATGTVTHWKTSIADSLDKIPGFKVDRESMFYPEMNKKEKEAFRKSRAAASSSPSDHEVGSTPVPDDKEAASGHTEAGKGDL